MEMDHDDVQKIMHEYFGPDFQKIVHETHQWGHGVIDKDGEGDPVNPITCYAAQVFAEKLRSEIHDGMGLKALAKAGNLKDAESDLNHILFHMLLTFGMAIQRLMDRHEIAPLYPPGFDLKDSSVDWNNAYYTEGKAAPESEAESIPLPNDGRPALEQMIEAIEHFLAKDDKKE